VTFFKALALYNKIKELEKKLKEAGVLKLLSGYKTYLVGIGMILYGVGGYAAGLHDWDTAMTFIMNGLAMMGLRAGVSKAIKANGVSK